MAAASRQLLPFLGRLAPRTTLPLSSSQSLSAVAQGKLPLRSFSVPSTPNPPSLVPNPFSRPYSSQSARNRDIFLKNHHTLHVQSSRNNVILTYSSSQTGGPVLRTITGGIDKDFKKSNRSSYEAATQAAIKMFDAIAERNKVQASERDQITVAFKGMFGQGREAVAAALVGPEGEQIRGMVVKVEDRTPIKIGGTRPRRPRRL